MRRDPPEGRLEQVLHDLGIAHRLTSRSFVMQCPQCGGKDKLYMFRTSGRFVCVKCRDKAESFSGAPEFALREITGRSLSSLRETIYGVTEVDGSVSLDVRFDAFVADDDEDVPVEAVQDELKEVHWPYHFVDLGSKAADPGRDYLRRRGVPNPVAAEYGIRYDVLGSQIAFPFYLDGTLVGWQTRRIDDLTYETEDGLIETMDKARSSTGTPRDRVVMFSHRLDGCDHAVLCEGPLDAIKAHLVGGNIATAGKGVAQAQCELLIRSGVRTIYLALDPDAVMGIDQTARRLDDPAVTLREVVIPGRYKDLGEMPLEEARDAVLAAEIYQPGKIRVFFSNPAASKARATVLP